MQETGRKLQLLANAVNCNQRSGPHPVPANALSTLEQLQWHQAKHGQVLFNLVGLQSHVLFRVRSKTKLLMALPFPVVRF